MTPTDAPLPEVPPPRGLTARRMTLLAAEEIVRFGIVPKVALLSHSSFGTVHSPTAHKMRRALDCFVDGPHD